MGAQRFSEWWFKPMLALCEAVQNASSVQDIHVHLKTSTGHMRELYSDEDLLHDCAKLAAHIGLKPAWVMGGASYHKIVFPQFVALHGPGGLYGPTPGGNPGDAKRAWRKESCIQWLDIGEEKWLDELWAMSLEELRLRVESNSSRVKFLVKDMAGEVGQ